MTKNTTTTQPNIYFRDNFMYDADTGILYKRRKSTNVFEQVGFAAVHANGRTSRGDNYLRIKHQNKTQYCHRLAWYIVYGVFPVELDHINQIKTDNRLCNLREVENYKENFYNRRPLTSDKKQTSIYKGVNEVYEGKWRARCSVENKTYHIGYFDTEVDAALAYNKMAKKLFGKYAWLNVIGEDHRND